MCLPCIQKEQFWCTLHDSIKILVQDSEIDDEEYSIQVVYACPKCTLEKLRALPPTTLQKLCVLIRKYGDPVFFEGLAILYSKLTKEKLADKENWLFVIMVYCELFEYKFSDGISTLIVHLSGSSLQ